jgi:hypothetical protein
MANELGQAQHGNLGLGPGRVVWRCIANGGADVSLLEKSSIEGESPVIHLQPPMHGIRLESHVPRDWSAKWVVNSI